MACTVVHCRKSPFDIYIGRPSIWGNPYKIGPDGTRAEVLEKYRTYILNTPKLRVRLPDLDGKVLGCWCYPAPCHGDVLSELVDYTRPLTD